MIEKKEKKIPIRAINFIGQIELFKKVSLNNLTFFLKDHLDLEFIPLTRSYA